MKFISLNNKLVINIESVNAIYLNRDEANLEGYEDEIVIDFNGGGQLWIYRDQWEPEFSSAEEAMKAIIQKLDKLP